MNDENSSPAAPRETILMCSGYPDYTLAELRKHYEIIDIHRQREAMAMLQGGEITPAVVCIGLVAPPAGYGDLTAGTMLPEILKLDPTMPVVISTGTRATTAIVELIKRGAFDYVIEPMDRKDPAQGLLYTQALLHAVNQAVQWRRITDENRRLKEDLTRKDMPDAIQARSRSMLEVMELVNKVAPTPATVLITGESGTGKELIAQTIHNRSNHRDKPFTAINCGALSETLLASELFGHVKGAFTGADSERSGLIRDAGEGTLLLDEIGSVSQSFQVMLLRVLEQRVARPVGSNREYPVRCRFIAAANQNLGEMVEQGQFRQDFYYRLNSFHIHLPPLRERKRDVPILAHHFLRQVAEQFGRKISRIDHAAMSLLESYDWPGNIRQLRNAIERAAIVCETDHITVADLDRQIRGGGSRVAESQHADESYHDAMHRHERQIILGAMQRAGGNLSEAARQLDMKRTTLAYRVRQLGLRA